MAPELLALIAAISFGLSANMVKRGTSRKPSSLNGVIMFSTASLVLWAVVLIADRSLPLLASWPLFILAGVLAPGISGLFNFQSIRNIGIPYAMPLMGSAPLWGFLLAIFVVDEQITLPIVAGTIVIMAGIFFLAWFRPKKEIQLAALALPILGAVGIGFSQVISKVALNLSDVPLGGIALSVSAGALTQVVGVTLMQRWSHIGRSFDEVKYYVIGGFTASVGMISLFLALSAGNVVVILPLVNTQALFGMLLSAVVFKGDRVTSYTLIGAVAVIVGSTLVSL